jgi:hypothetical protein
LSVIDHVIDQPTAIRRTESSMNAYLLLVYAHSYLRWAVLALALLVCAASARAWLRSGEWTPAHERLHRTFVAVVDLQFTFGLVLYVWLSPYVHAFYAGPGAAMKDATLRFFGVEHVLSMLVAVSIIHVARVRSKRLPLATLRHRRVLLTTLAALVLMLIAVPWPFLPYGRPLFRAIR